MDNLRPLAMNIALAREAHSDDAGTRIMALEDKLAEVQKALENILDAIEKMGQLLFIIVPDRSFVETAASYKSCLDYQTT